MPANVHVIDKRGYPNDTNIHEEIRLSRRAPGSYPNLVFCVNRGTSIESICRSALQVSGGRIGVLRLLSHGNASSVEIGGGLANAASVRPFEALRGCWIGRYPKVVVDACGVASATPVNCQPNASPDSGCTPGTEPNSYSQGLLHDLANAAGILVVASLEVQWGPTPRGLEGRIRYYRPDVYFHAADR